MIGQRDVDVRSLYFLYVTGEEGIRTLIEAATVDSGYRTLWRITPGLATVTTT